MNRCISNETGHIPPVWRKIGESLNHLRNSSLTPLLGFVHSIYESFRRLHGTHPLPRPTDGELAILRVLWTHGPCTVRQAHEVLSRDRDTGYTTVLKMLQIMTEKGLVTREEEGRGHIYAARLGRPRPRSIW